MNVGGIKMYVVENMPYKKPITKLLKGEVLEDVNGRLWVGDTHIPANLEKKFRKRASGDGYLSIQEAVDYKNIYLRGHNKNRSVNWFGLVSAEFEEITAHGFAKELGKIDHSKQVIRYNPCRERFQIGFVVDDDDAKIMMYLDSGDYGVYGGNGESAVRIGLSAYQKDPVQWSLFKTVGKNIKARTIHRESSPDLDKVIATNLELVKEVKKSWCDNVGREYTRGEVAEFALEYVKQATIVFQSIVENMGHTIKGNDLIAEITKKAQCYALPNRLGLELLTGDLLLYPERISKRY